MSTYNIEMNTYNGSTYDQLYPKTYLSNILDWTSSIYSKTEVDNLINNIEQLITLPTGNIDIVNSMIFAGEGNADTSEVKLPKKVSDYHYLLTQITTTSTNSYRISVMSSNYLNCNFSTSTGRDRYYFLTIPLSLKGVVSFGMGASLSSSDSSSFQPSTMGLINSNTELNDSIRISALKVDGSGTGLYIAIYGY